MKKTTEQKTAETILQLPEKITIGGKKYTVAKPSTATLIMASAEISKLPHFNIDEKTLSSDVLRIAKDSDGVGDVVAIMIVGAKGLYRKGIIRLFKLWRIRRMKRIVLEGLRADELQELTYKLFSSMQVGDFFGLITFLSGVNITKETKVTTTASGQQSEVS